LFDGGGFHKQVGVHIDKIQNPLPSITKPPDAVMGPTSTHDSIFYFSSPSITESFGSTKSLGFLTLLQR
jgi:hypothetical protein